jgi:hypothetical protein
MTQEFDYKKLFKAYIESVDGGIYYYNKVKRYFSKLSNEEIEEIKRLEDLPISNDEFDLTK